MIVIIIINLVVSMKKFIHLGVLCYIAFMIFIVTDFGSANKNSNLHHRSRRYLSFRNNTNFFIRLNFRANMVWWNQIFAQALGFRINWMEPPDTFHPYHHLYRRSVYQNLEVILDKNGLDGFHCVRRAICEIGAIEQPTGVYYRILKMVFRQQSSSSDRWHNVSDSECPTSINRCPFSLLDVSPYTDM